jgi:hypothetical protein
MECVKKLFLDKELIEQREALRSMMDVPTDGGDIGGKVEVEVEVGGLCGGLLADMLAVDDGAADDRVLEDVEMFRTWSTVSPPDSPPPDSPPLTSPPPTCTEKTVFDVFARQARLSGGRETLRAILQSPTSDALVLRRRQDSLAKLVASDASLIASLRARLDRMAAWEADVAWACATQSEEVQALHNMAFFQTWFLRGLNLSPAALTAFAWQRIVLNPLIGMLTPLFYVIAPYLVMRYNGINIGFVAYVRMLYRSFSIAGALMTSGVAGGAWIRNLSCGFTVLFYFQSLFGSFEIARTLYTVCKILTTRIAHVHAFARDARSMYEDLKVTGIDLGGAWGARLREPMPIEDVPDLPTRFSMFSNFGRALAAFRSFDGALHTPAIEWAFLIDAVVAVESTRAELAMCYPSIVTSAAAPVMDARGIWHPCLPRSTAVPNDVALGTKNMLLTGPNAGGKSTLLKALLIAALLAQTVAIAPCQDLRITPFASIRSQVNVPDCKGSQSLFEAEMLRCKATLDDVRKLDAEGRFSLTVMDEIFSSTNVVEGIAGAFAVAKALAKCACNVAVISTHFVYLSRLAKATTRFENHMMQVDIADDTIRYPYKMTRGVSKQHIALELLRLNGFDEDVLDEAFAVRARLVGDSKKMT